MKRLFAPFLAQVLAQTLGAAVVQGVVLEQETGAPLARALVQLIPVEGTRASAVSLRTADRGTFAVMNVAPGWYILRGSRAAYVPAEIGQSRPGRPGHPFQVERDDQSFFLDLRLIHTGAISGVVLDENNVGLPDWKVNVYTARKPVIRVAEGKTDDRGNFRIWGLPSGKYLVRSAEGDLEDGTTVLATYHKFGTVLQTAEPVAVKIGETTTDIRVQPVKGRLFTLQGTVGGDCDRLTLVTDTGRRFVSPGDFQIEHVPPGRVDMIAEGRASGGVLHLSVDRDLNGLAVPCQFLHPAQVALEGERYSREQGQLALRRIDLDGAGGQRTLRRGETITPGTYEAMAVPGDSGLYAWEMVSERRRSQLNPNGSFTVEISNQPTLSASLRSAARIDGSVLSDAKPVVGAPVVLEMFDPKQPEDDQRLRLWTVQTDLQGKFSLPGLAPAMYRLKSTFEFDPEDRNGMENSAVLTLKSGDSTIQELKMLP